MRSGVLSQAVHIVNFQIGLQPRNVAVVNRNDNIKRQVDQNKLNNILKSRGVFARFRCDSWSSCSLINKPHIAGGDLSRDDDHHSCCQ